ncbi:hypothetical protein M3Y97_00302000 [Aphelenchoides bicaudatus]|nr:hypothetical protein M3Y97_00302000 [Aphelenchoides bicaudatus]
MFCADELVAFLQQNQFDGAVFEFWLQILVNTQGQAMDYLIEMTEIFGKRLHLKELEYIVPLTPAQQNMNPNERTYLPPNVIPRLFKAVDYLQLMSYDFNGNDAEGNAPLPWIRNNVHLLLFDNPQYASKVLIGLNYYGRCKGSSNDAILGNKFIELLNDPEFEMYWDEAVNENFIANDENKCYFPTLQSINDRLNFVQDENLAGVAIWETGQGLNHFSISAGNSAVVESESLFSLYSEMNLRLFILFAFLLICVSQATLSKGSDKNEEAEETNSNAEQLLDEEVIKDEELRNQIIDTHEDLDTTKAKHNFTKLVYVTPWNEHGYNTSKWTAQKYTIASPAWFQIIPGNVSGEITCEIDGQHDVDRNWLDDIRKNNSAIKIVPRFLFDALEIEDIEQFLTTDTAYLKCADEVANFLQRNQFDGAVFDFWQPILEQVEMSAMDYLVELTETFGRRLSKKNLLYIVPLKPPQENIAPSNSTYLDKKYIPRLFKAVDYLQLVSYDFNGNDGEGNSPFEYIKNNLDFLLTDYPEFAPKILLGMNYHGKCRGTVVDGPISGPEFMELLPQEEYEFFWDDDYKENYIVNTNRDTLCLYPTTKSINKRLDLVKERKLGGVAIWEIGLGLNHFSSVL